MSEAEFEWAPRGSTSSEAHRDGMRLEVWYGKPWGAKDGVWYVFLADEVEGAMGITDLEWSLDVSIPGSFPTEQEAKRAAEALFHRVAGWFKEEREKTHDRDAGG